MQPGINEGGNQKKFWVSFPYCNLSFLYGNCHWSKNCDGSSYPSMQVQWNLPYPDLFYPSTSIVWTAQINYVVCSLLAVIMFCLDKSTRRQPKGCYLLVGWLVYTTTNCYHWLLVDKAFLQPRGGTMNALQWLPLLPINCTASTGGN